ncbi:hypothetical protein D3C81_1129790 [compost metagenome]
MANPSVDAVTDQRVEEGPKRQRQPLSIGEVGHAQADQGEDRPRVKRPVEQRYPHRHGRRFIRQPGGKRVAGVMQHRLGHGPENQADPHAGAEQHGNPGTETEFGLVVVGAELQVGEPAGGYVQQQAEHAADQRQVVPFEGVQDGCGCRLEGLGGLFILERTEQYKQDYGENRSQRYVRV